jgi:hypothetical protein
MGELERFIRQGGVEAVIALDVLRALVVFGGSLWLSELGDAISRVRLGELEYGLDEKLLFGVLRKLSSMGAVSLEERVRASDRASGERDVLVRLASESVKQLLIGDQVINRYYSSMLAGF